MIDRITKADRNQERLQLWLDKGGPQRWLDQAPILSHRAIDLTRQYHRLPPEHITRMASQIRENNMNGWQENGTGKCGGDA